MSIDDLTLSRRKTLQAGIGAAVIVGGMMTGHHVLAQDANVPAATDADATPEMSPDEAALPTTPPEYVDYANDWPMAQGNLPADRVAAGGAIDSSNVATLGVAWELPLDASSAYGAITSNPVVQGDTIYLIDNEGNVSAIDRASGTVRWKNEYNVPTLGPNGVALGYGILVGVLGDTAEVLGLDPETGAELWRTQLTNQYSLGISMAPHIYDGIVIVSTEPGGNAKTGYGGGADGIVYGLDVQTGITIWSWNTVEDALWGNFRVNSGGGLWYPPAIDEQGVLYMGIGNAGPWFPLPDQPNDLATRPGENNYANNIVALDPNAGKVLWNLNVKPRDLYDHDNQQTPVLGTVAIGGIDVPVVVTTGKHGYVVGVHRDSGQEIWRTPVGRHQNDGMIDLPDEAIEIYPGTLGGVESPAAMKDGVVYVAALNFPAYLGKLEFNYSEGSLSDATSNIVAIDASNGRVIWDVELPTGVAGPGPTISGDVLFVGSLDGIVRAFQLETGEQVWSSQTSAGLNAPFAIAGDLLLVPAGSVIIPSGESPDPVPGYGPALIAYQL
ncbi:MAG TPA: PQQ-binding-like beta-propeller repeat protein, partial [Thermomicrobiales bacterium]|nr:PQQ-binding-like beta-propeller repeat protein [Thermomicrobiales bacterium]